jgi:dsRNA-specific ribonuclease
MGLFVGDELVAQGEGSSKKKGEEAAAKIFYHQTAELTNG